MKNLLIITAIIIWLVTVIFFLFSIYAPTPAHAGTTFQDISASTIFLRIRDDVEAKRNATAATARKIAKQKEQSRSHRNNFKNNQDGAMIFCGSDIIK